MGLRWRCLRGELSRRCAYEAVELKCMTRGALVCTEREAYEQMVGSGRLKTEGCRPSLMVQPRAPGTFVDTYAQKLVL